MIVVTLEKAESLAKKDNKTYNMHVQDVIASTKISKIFPYARIENQAPP